VLIWHHRGYGQVPGLLYTSERRVVAAAPPAFEAALGGGVSARIPLAVVADSGGTLPRTARTAARLPSPTRSSSLGGDRAARLAAVILAWSVFEHFYPYFDVVNSDWNEILRPALEQAAIDATDADFTLTLRHLLAGLRDGHATVVHPADAPFVPPVALDWLEGQLVVTDAAPATGLARGDLVIAVEGAPAPLALEERERSISGATPQWLRTRALQEVLSGAAGSVIRLRVERRGAPGRNEDVTLQRSIAGRYLPPAVRDKVAELQPGVLYADLTRLTAAELIAAIPRLATAKAAVFDLRGDQAGPGPEVLLAHLATQLMTTPPRHVPEIVRPDRVDMRFVPTAERTITPAEPRITARVAFLADGRSIGGAESWLTVVARYRLGEIVGAPTAGTTGDTVHFGVPGGYTMTFTGVKVLKHDGSVHHGVGVAPTIGVSPTRAGVADGRDEVLERAVQDVSMP
jgi:C-terminal processing protease CtpA/Prc